MKKYLKSLLSLLLISFASLSINSACLFLSYEAPIPEEIEKYNKLNP